MSLNKEELLKKREEILARLEVLNLIAKKNQIFFFKPFKWQKERVIENIRKKNTVVVTSCNKIGKSCIGVNIINSWAMGFEAWNEVAPEYPGAVKFENGYYMPSSLNKKPPVKIIITGEDWKLHIGQTIIPEIKKWTPMDMIKDTKKNEQGVEYYWKWKNGSSFLFMCYNQDDSLFESFICDALWMDEPPPKPKFDAMSRGLLLTSGKTLMTMTPLKEPWILDELILSGRKDIASVDGLNILENEYLYNYECEILKKSRLNDLHIAQYFDLVLYEDKEKKSPVRDKGKRAEKYLESVIPEKLQENIASLKILKFIKDIDPSQVAPRIFGKFKALVGRILEEYDPAIHVIEPFEIPSDYPVVPMIDFHMSTPQAISYWTVDKQDIHYCIKETWKHCNAEQIADDIVKNKKRNAWNIEKAYIDPFVKGYDKYFTNELGTDSKHTFGKIEEILTDNEISLITASKERNDGLLNIKTRLRGPNGMPTAYIFNTCERIQYELLRYVYDDNGAPPNGNKVDDHFIENWYRFELTPTEYISPHKPEDINYDYSRHSWQSY